MKMITDIEHLIKNDSSIETTVWFNYGDSKKTYKTKNAVKQKDMSKIEDRIIRKLGIENLCFTCRFSTKYE